MNNLILAFKHTFNDLKSNRYVTFYLPSIVVSFLFLPLYGGIQLIDLLNEGIQEIPLVGKLIALAIHELTLLIKNFIDFIFSFLLLTALSPVNARLSEKIEENHTLKTYTFTFKLFLKNITRISVIFIFLGLTSFIFGNLIDSILNLFHLQLLITPIAFLLSSFFYGWAFMDYSLERRSYNLDQTRVFVSSHWKECLIVGIVFLVLFKIPYLGLLIAPIVTTIFATHTFLQITKN